MSIRALRPEDVVGCEFVPQAVLRRPPSFFADRGVRFHDGHDDLDAFIVAELSLEGTGPFALMRYRGTPDDETTVFLTSDVPLHDVGAVVGSIAGAFELAPSAIAWQRTISRTPF